MNIQIWAFRHHVKYCLLYFQRLEKQLEVLQEERFTAESMLLEIKTMNTEASEINDDLQNIHVEELNVRKPVYILYPPDCIVGVKKPVILDPFKVIIDTYINTVLISCIIHIS